MGCASSKQRVEDTVATAYRPPPTSFAVFDINSIEEPWLKHLNKTSLDPSQHENKSTLTHVPAPILQKLNMLDSTEVAPQSWDEVSKTLDELKSAVKPSSSPTQQEPQSQSQPQLQMVIKKNASFHTLEELDAKLTSKPKPDPKPELKKNISYKSKLDQSQPLLPSPQPLQEGGLRIKPVKENIFVMRDRLEREKEEKVSIFEKIRRDPLTQYLEKCPPNGSDSVVIYTTSLRGVRKTFDDCNRARDMLEGHRVIFDERDVSLHGEFLKEVKELLEGVEEGGVVLPKVFVKGRYVGGLNELVELNETGRLGRILNATRVERGVGRQGCEGCGGVRFVPCLDCSGSCKIGADKERCPKCNENGLVHCPLCI
ncbi:hypothetical protein Lal_00016572 [Lupinus albus]|uniref:Putative thioredoxin-like protein n=1 Tax=Lupinus albus TaxID=3870 RepID=A0A6A4QJF1_LUPAL|nr:putative thioredoxin-like protein [Lupinus albus]KAF1872735.1 hypothetical protein Lal_00016572 [Lupinus albus]